ncbi:MAG: hypothetical protein CMK56_03735 [Proteobacteria bacterium]|nr:hypothetical protein [Pseudomonadota bacterium]|tara:strand:- start:2159 stop:2815 length:657 start_codon:yes stop_codon:yes gene_type:complete
MAGITYSDLVTKIRNYTEVDSTVFTDAIINGFILDAEERILRDVNTDADRKYAVANMVLDQKFLNFPDGALVIRAIQITSGSSKIYLEKRDTTFIDEYNNTSATGVPKYYSNLDNDTLVFAPIPNATFSIQASYVAKPDGLSSTNTQTYVSKNFPNGLLYACLIEAFGYLKGPMDMLQYYEKQYNNAIAKYAIEQIGRRRRDDYFNGAIRIKIDSPSP